MLKWLYTIVYALSFKMLMRKQQIRISFSQALRFVRCDFLIQEEIAKKLGIEDPSKKGDNHDKESD